MGPKLGKGSKEGGPEHRLMRGVENTSAFAHARWRASLAASAAGDAGAATFDQTYGPPRRVVFEPLRAPLWPGFGVQSRKAHLGYSQMVLNRHAR